MHEYEIAILNLLKKHKSMDPDSIQSSTGIERGSLLRALENLSESGFVKIERESNKVPKLTEEGKKYLKQFPEEELVKHLDDSKGPSSLGALQTIGKNPGIGIIWAKTNGWINIEKGQAKLTEKGKEIAQGKKTYPNRDILNKINDSGNKDISMLIKQNENAVDSLKKRNLLEIYEKGIIKDIGITEKGNIEKLVEEKGIGALTRDVIVNKKWERSGLRHYDIYADTDELYPARLHPMHEFIDIIRSSWFKMGFTEVSGPIIESAFWNFDALFSPQDHPTREMQDTFFLKNPQKIGIEDIALMNRVKKMHTKNWKETWKEDVAQQALLQDPYNKRVCKIHTQIRR